MFGHPWTDLPMIFTRDCVSRKSGANRFTRDQNSLFMPSHTSFYVSRALLQGFRHKKSMKTPTDPSPRHSWLWWFSRFWYCDATKRPILMSFTLRQSFLRNNLTSWSHALSHHRQVHYHSSTSREYAICYHDPIMNHNWAGNEWKLEYVVCLQWCRVYFMGLSSAFYNALRFE